MASLSIPYLVVGVIALLAGLAMLVIALRQRGDAANPKATAMLIGGMMVMTFGLLMSAFLDRLRDRRPGKPRCGKCQ